MIAFEEQHWSVSRPLLIWMNAFWRIARKWKQHIFISSWRPKVLQYGRTGRSSFTNNEASCLSDEAAAHSLKHLSPTGHKALFMHEAQISFMCIYLLISFRFLEIKSKRGKAYGCHFALNLDELRGFLF